MNCVALDKSLQRRVISPVYLFYGEETYLRDGFIERFKALVPENVRDFNMDLLDGRETEMNTVIGFALTLPFMSDKRLVIVKNAAYFKAKRKTQSGSENTSEDNEEKSNTADSGIIDYLNNPLDSTCLIFCTDSVDKKRKIYKSIEKNGQVVEFVPFKGRELDQWIDRKARNLGRVIEPKAVALLVTAIGSDLQQLCTELEKLACYSTTDKITSADVELMVSKTAELSVFELVDAIGERNYSKAIKMAREMVFLGEPVIKLLFMIARQFRLLLRAREMHEQGHIGQQIAGQLQVHPFVAQKCVKQARNFSLTELKEAMQQILSTDSDIKTGRQEAPLALELLIIELCEKKTPVRVL